MGPATAAALETVGVHADLIPDRFVAEAVVEALEAAGAIAGSRILLPRADLARPLLAMELQARGAEVTEVAAYRTIADGEGVERLQSHLAAGEVDMITFTASSTVRNFVDLAGTEIGGARVASIGPITSATARELGLPVHLEAAEYTVPGLIRVLREWGESSGA